MHATIEKRRARKEGQDASHIKSSLCSSGVTNFLLLKWWLASRTTLIPTIEHGFYKVY